MREGEGNRGKGRKDGGGKYFQGQGSLHHLNLLEAVNETEHTNHLEHLAGTQAAIDNYSPIPEAAQHSGEARLQSQKDFGSSTRSTTKRPRD